MKIFYVIMRLIEKIDSGYTKALEAMHCAVHPYVITRPAIEFFTQMK